MAAKDVPSAPLLGNTLYPVAGSLSASAVKFAFICAPWVLSELPVGVLSRCYFRLRQWGQEEERAWGKEDAERKLGYDEPGSLRDSQADISPDHGTEGSGTQGEQAGYGSHPCQVGMGTVPSPAAVRTRTDPAACLHCCCKHWVWGN